MLVSGLAALAGYGLFDGASPSTPAFVNAFAAGAILTMLADTMMPEAFEHGGKLVGIFTTFVCCRVCAQHAGVRPNRAPASASAPPPAAPAPAWRRRMLLPAPRDGGPVCGRTRPASARRQISLITERCT